MGIFTDAELDYLRDERRLARIATVGRDGTPHVVPVGWSYDPSAETIEVGGFNLERTKKFRDARRSHRAAIVIDELVSVDPWRVRGIEVRGRAETLRPPRACIRIYPERVISWGLESEAIGERHARTVS